MGSCFFSGGDRDMAILGVILWLPQGHLCHPALFEAGDIGCVMPRIASHPFAIKKHEGWRTLEWGLRPQGRGSVALLPFGSCGQPTTALPPIKKKIEKSWPKSPSGTSQIFYFFSWQSFGPWSFRLAPKRDARFTMCFGAILQHRRNYDAGTNGWKQEVSASNIDGHLVQGMSTTVCSQILGGLATRPIGLSQVWRQLLQIQTVEKHKIF